MQYQDPDPITIPRQTGRRWITHLNHSLTKLALWFAVNDYSGERGLPANESYRIAEGINVSRNTASRLLSTALDKRLILKRTEGSIVSYTLNLTWEPPH